MIGLDKHWRPLLLVSLFPILLGFNILTAAFQFDDSMFIVKGVFSDRIKDFHRLWLFSLHGGYFQRTVHWWTLAINYRLGRLNPFGYHLVNLLIHGWNGLLVYVFCRRLAALWPGKFVRGAQGLPNTVSLFSLLAALLFLLFPIQTETVAYISSRSSSLVAFFYLLGAVFFLRFLWQGSGRATRVQRIISVSGILICLLIGLGVKKTIMSLPIMLFLIFFFHQNISLARFTRQFRWALILLFLMGSLGAGMKVYSFYHHFRWNGKVLENYRAAHEGGYVDSRAEFLRKRCFESIFLGPGTAAGLYSPRTYFMTELHVVPCYYLRKIFFPFDLNISPDVPIEGRWRGWTLVLILGIPLSFLLTWRPSALYPVVPLALAWFFVTLLPTSSFIPLYDVASEHRTYVASPGCAMGAGFLIFLLCARRPTARSSALTSAALVLMFVSFATVFVTRNFVWQSELSLWSDAADKSPRSGRAHHNLGLAYAGKNFLPRAILEYNKALEIQKAADTYVNLAEAYKKSGSVDKAIHTLRIAIEMDPKFSPAYYNLGVLYHDLGRYGEAVPQYERAIEVNKNYPEAYNNLGEIYVKRGQLDKARKYFKKALVLRPFHVAALNNLATVYQKENNLKQAERYYRKALKANSRAPEAYFNLGTLYAKMGRLHDAEARLREAVRLNRNFSAAHVILGDVLIKERRFQEAARSYQTALLLKPDDPVLHRNLGILYYNELHDIGKALYHFKRTLQLDPDQGFAESMRKIIREN